MALACVNFAAVVGAIEFGAAARLKNRLTVLRTMCPKGSYL